METRQYYETTIFDTENDLSAKIITVPSRSYQFNLDEITTDDMIEILGLEVTDKVEMNDLTEGLANVLGYDSEIKLRSYKKEDDSATPSLTFKETHRSFAQHIINSDVIPFENSPLEAESLGKIIAGSGAVGVGTTIGFIIAGPSPLLLVTVPAGIIICGASIGVSKALQNGLYDRFNNWLSGK